MGSNLHKSCLTVTVKKKINNRYKKQISAVPTLSNEASIAAETSSSVVEATEVTAEPRMDARL